MPSKRTNLITRAVLVIALICSLGASVSAEEEHDMRLAGLCVGTSLLITFVVITDGLPILIAAGIGGFVADSVSFLKEHQG